MSEIRDTQRLLQTYLEHMPLPESGRAKGRVLAEALTAMDETKQRAAPRSRRIWRTIMMSRASRLTAAALVAGVVLFALFDSFSQPAWALEDAIKALKDFHAVHVVGAFPGGTAEVWMRADQARTQSTDTVVRGSQGAITWTRDGSTYHYEPGQNTVYFERALTIGLSQWLGPELLEMLGTAENAKVIRGKDPATGRERVLLLCSLIDVHGAQSWAIEFDAASRLPVTLKQWPNLDRNGPPSFDAFRITYYEDLPDNIFEVHIPGDARHVEKPLAIPDDTVGVLSNPRDGIRAEGMTQQEAAEKAVRTVYQAVVDQNLDQLKNISPLCRNWGDEFLRKVVLKADKEERIVEIVKIGRISRTGRSPLGPLAAVPTVLKLKNGKKIEEQMIVQFRQLGGESSCVVHGPYGLPREVE